MRKTISLITLFSSVLLLITSVVLYIVPQGRVAYWANWQLWGLSKTTWSELHINLGVLFTVVAVWHSVLNWSTLLSYLRRARNGLRSPSTGYAAAITVAVLVGTFFHLPPFEWVLQLNSAVKNRAAVHYGEPPYGHAELSSLAMLVRNTGLNHEEVLQRLRDAKLQVKSSEQSVQQIADANQLSPQQLFEVIRPPLAAGEFPPLPQLPPPGLGRITLTEICLSYGLNGDELIKQLNAQGLVVEGEMTIKQIATTHGKNPIAIYELIRKLTQPDGK